MARYFVTGATGFVGAEVAKQLRTRGHKVVALVRTPEKASLLAKLGCELHVGDITNPATLRAGMRDVDGVFHLAGWSRTGEPDARALATTLNVDGTRHVLEVMRELAVPRGVHSSTLAVFSDTHGTLVDETYRFNGRHLSIYDETKWHAHYEVALPAIAAGLPLVIVQPGLVYGPGDPGSVRGILINHLRRRLPFVPSASAYCWAHVDDTAHAHIEAMEQGRIGETYIIAGPPHSLRDAVRIAARASGRPAPLGGIPPFVMRGAAAVAGLFEAAVTLPPSLSAETLRVAAGVTYLGSNAKAARELGYAPRSLDEGLRHVIEHEMRVLGLGPR